jgi:hypothetical protein
MFLLSACDFVAAQATIAYENLFIRDFTDKNGKKWDDPSLREDVEALFYATNASRVLLYEANPNIVVLFKNERHLKELSAQTVEQLSQKGVSYLLSGVCDKSYTDVVQLQFNIRSLKNNATEYAGTLQMSPNTFNNRMERNLKLKEFIEYNILKMSPPRSKIPLYGFGAGAGIGLGALAVGTASSISRRNDWRAYFDKSPTDPQGRFLQERQKFRTTTAIAIAGGVVATSCGILFLREMKRRGKGRMSSISAVPQKTQFVPQMGQDGFGIAMKF